MNRQGTVKSTKQLLICKLIYDKLADCVILKVNMLFCNYS